MAKVTELDEPSVYLATKCVSLAKCVREVAASENLEDLAIQMGLQDRIGRLLKLLVCLNRGASSATDRDDQAENTDRGYLVTFSHLLHPNDEDQAP